jgi:hypothetical protein
MVNLSNPNTSFILFSPHNESNSELENKSNFEKACSILYSKDYTILEVEGIYRGIKEKSILAFPISNNNDNLRSDSLFLIDTFQQESLIVKYSNETNSKKILNNGSEKPLSIAMYNLDYENKTYLHDGVSFSFIEEKVYYFPKQKSELKNGMIVEYFNENVWKSKTITHLDEEYESLFKLLIKYNKLRFSENQN